MREATKKNLALLLITEAITNINKSILNVPADIGKETKILMVRPEDFILESGTDGKSNGIVKTVDFSGSIQTLRVELKNGETVQVSGSPHLLWTPEDSVKITAERYLCFDSAGNRLNGCSSARVSK